MTRNARNADDSPVKMDGTCVKGQATITLKCTVFAMKHAQITTSTIQNERLNNGNI